MTPAEKEYLELYKKMAMLCAKENWGDPFSYARSKEIYAAIVLGHSVAETFSGADSYDEDGLACEFKSTTQKTCRGSYTGVSVQDTWEEQERYLAEEKIKPYQHFYNRFKDGELVEAWTMDGNIVHQLLLPKFKKKFATVLTKKDPRLSATINWAEIKKHGTKVI